jgi:hypothetical protein
MSELGKRKRKLNCEAGIFAEKSLHELWTPFIQRQDNTPGVGVGYIIRLHTVAVRPTCN